MTHRERDSDRERAEQNPPSEDLGGEDLRGRRLAATQFLAAGAEAIDRALSSNSEAFLAANRQQGGQ